jgi:hypothetical protein
LTAAKLVTVGDRRRGVLTHGFRPPLTVADAVIDALLLALVLPLLLNCRNAFEHFDEARNSRDERFDPRDSILATSVVASDGYWSASPGHPSR